MSVHHMRASPTKDRRGHQIPWYGSSRSLLATRCVLGMEPLEEQKVLFNSESSLQPTEAVFLKSLLVYFKIESLSSERRVTYAYRSPRAKARQVELLHLPIWGRHSVIAKTICKHSSRFCPIFTPITRAC